MRRARHRPAARTDVRDLLKTSSRNFGPRARRDYKALLDRAVAVLCANPKRPGVQQCDDMQENTFLFHLRNARTRAKRRNSRATSSCSRSMMHHSPSYAYCIDSMDVEQHMGAQGELS
ncbi:MAG: hypothetical protein ABL883_11975 [Terricaulis sp.]